MKISGSITKTKWHDQEFIVAFMSSESWFGDVNFLHAYLMIAKAEFKLGKEFITMEFIKKIIHHGNREFVLDSELVKGPKFKTHAP